MEAKEIEKMTVVKLREECLTIPKISGVHGMNKQQLVHELKKFHGIPVDIPKKPKTSVKSLKINVASLRKELEKARSENNKQRVGYLQKRLSKMKKRTRRAQ